MSHQNIYEMRDKTDIFPLLPIPVVVGVKGSHQNGHIRVDALQNLIQILAVVWKLIFFKYFFIFIMLIFVTSQYKHPMPLFAELQNHTVDQAAGASCQQDIH